MDRNQNSKASEQRIYLNSHKYEPYVDKKQARIELRAFKDALPLNIVSDKLPKKEVPVGVDLKRVSAYCVGDRIHLKNLTKGLSKDQNISKTTIYFGECCCTKMAFNDENNEIKEYDIFLFDYGVVVCWGLNEKQEAHVLRYLRSFIEGRYDIENMETEIFSYGIVEENPRVINDIIYLNSDFYFNKMVISNPIAQSIKLDYFEKIVDDTIENVRDLPEEIENMGKVGKNRKEVLRMVGRLHRLRFNLNLISNILDEPEILWHYPEYTNLYQCFNHYLEIKPRTGVLNQRCDIIQSILEILSDNISTRNSEKLEKTIMLLNFGSLVIGLVQIVLLWYVVKK